MNTLKDLSSPATDDITDDLVVRSRSNSDKITLSPPRLFSPFILSLCVFCLCILSLSLSQGVAQNVVQLDTVGEPTVQSVQQVALRYAALNPEIFKSMRSRSRIQAVLPQLTVRTTKDLDNESRSLTRYGETNEAQDISATEVVGDDLQLYAEVRWKLNETIFNYQETAVMRENRYSAKERQKLLQTVTQVYFERKRTLLKMRSSRSGKDQKELNLLKLAEIEAELDALTGGWFTKQLPKTPVKG